MRTVRVSVYATIRHVGIEDLLHPLLCVLDIVLEHVAPCATLGPRSAEFAASLALRVCLRARELVLFVVPSAQNDEVQLLMGDREPLGDIGELVHERPQLIDIPGKPMEAKRADP